MQMPSPPMTPFEEHITQSYQMLHAARLQSMSIYHGSAFCMQKCLDTEELYTLNRTQNAPIKYRLQKDLEEKDCVRHCACKWDEVLKVVVTEANEKAIAQCQADQMVKLMQSMQQ